VATLPALTSNTTVQTITSARLSMTASALRSVGFSHAAVGLSLNHERRMGPSVRLVSTLDRYQLVQNNQNFSIAPPPRMGTNAPTKADSAGLMTAVAAT
jgi:hypothetical protein